MNADRTPLEKIKQEERMKRIGMSLGANPIAIENYHRGFNAGWAARECAAEALTDTPDDRCPDENCQQCGYSDRWQPIYPEGTYMCMNCFSHISLTGKKPPRYRTPEQFEAEEWRKPDDMASIWMKHRDNDYWYQHHYGHIRGRDWKSLGFIVVLAIEGYGPPTTDWRPTNEGEEK